MLLESCHWRAAISDKTLVGFILFLLSTFAGVIVSVQVQSSEAQSSLAVSNAVVDDFSTSIQLPAGGRIYLYGYATGGGLPSTLFTSGQYASVTNAAGNVAASLAVTSSNTNSYTSQSAYPMIGGAAISGYSSYSSTYGSNNAPAATSASASFVVSQDGSLVVVVALAGSEQCQQVSGVPGLTVDASNAGTTGLPPAITIGHAYASAGFYTVTETTSQCAAGQTPDNAGDLIGVFVFVPAGTTSQITTTTVTQTITSTLTIDHTVTTTQPTTTTVTGATTITSTTTSSFTFTTTVPDGGGFLVFSYEVLSLVLTALVAVESLLLVRRKQTPAGPTERD